MIEQVQDRLNKIEAYFLNKEYDNVLDKAIELRTVQKRLEALAKTFKSEVDEISSDVSVETDEMDDGVYKGYKFTYRQGAERYNYKEIPAWKMANNRLKAVERKYKSFYERTMSGEKILNTAGVKEHLPEVKHSKSSLIIKKQI